VHTYKQGPHSRQHDALGRAVRETCARRGLSQEELGADAGLRRNYVGAIERGEINPTFRVMLKLARGLTSSPPSRRVVGVTGVALAPTAARAGAGPRVPGLGGPRTWA